MHVSDLSMHAHTKKEGQKTAAPNKENISSDILHLHNLNLLWSPRASGRRCFHKVFHYSNWHLHRDFPNVQYNECTKSYRRHANRPCLIPSTKSRLYERTFIIASPAIGCCWQGRRATSTRCACDYVRDYILQPRGWLVA